MKIYIFQHIYANSYDQFTYYKDIVDLFKKNINLRQVIHSFNKVMKRIFFLVIFQLFFFVNSSFSDHLTLKIKGFINATSPIHIWGYDKKFFFKEKSAPLFMIKEADINNFNQINLRAYPHIMIGIFAFQDLDEDGELTVDLKGKPLEPYGFSLNPTEKFQDIIFENFVFDMNKFSDIEINLK